MTKEQTKKATESTSSEKENGVDEVLVPENNEPITLPLEESDRLLLEAKESRLILAKQKVISRIEMAFALKKQEAIQSSLSGNPDVVALTRTLDLATNKVLDNVENLLPEGYAVKELTWENGTLTAIHAPKQRSARRKVK